MAPLPVTFSSIGPIIIPGSGTGPGPANPYPSSILVSGINHPVSSIQIRLNELTSAHPDDIDILLESPTGQKMVIMSDAGGADDVSNITLTLEDNALLLLPGIGPLVTGSFRPADFIGGSNFDSPAPPPPYEQPEIFGSSTLNGTFLTGLPASLNGTWNLWIMDDDEIETSMMFNWQITFVFSDIPCLYQDTLVHIPNGKKKIMDIKAGDYVIDYKGNAVKVEYKAIGRTSQ